VSAWAGRVVAWEGGDLGGWWLGRVIAGVGVGSGRWWLRRVEAWVGTWEGGGICTSHSGRASQREPLINI